MPVRDHDILDLIDFNENPDGSVSIDPKPLPPRPLMLDDRVPLDRLSPRALDFVITALALGDAGVAIDHLATYANVQLTPEAELNYQRRLLRSRLGPRKHNWGKGEIVGYHPQVEPRWVTEFGYRQPKMRYQCQDCGYVLHGDGGSGFLLYGLGQEDCPGPGRAVRQPYAQPVHLALPPRLTPFQRLIGVTAEVSMPSSPVRPYVPGFVGYLDPLPPVPPKRVDFRRPRRSPTAEKRRAEKKERRRQRK